jgi:hypothetical protein
MKRMGVHCLRTGLQPFNNSQSQTVRIHDVNGRFMTVGLFALG